MKRAVFVVLCMIALARAAAADERARPWAEGVPAEQQEAALRLFRDGNDAFGQSEYAEAARLYREALVSWDHPAIRGNLAVSLIHLDQPIEAYQHLELALRYGAAPFDETHYQQLVTNRKLLLGQIATVRVASRIDGAQVTLDGETLFAGRGESVRVVKAGSHQVVARKPGHLTFSKQFTAFPEQPVDIEVVLVPLAEAGGYERRWAAWKPWAIAGGGAVVVALGVVLQVDAGSNLDEFEQEVARLCPDGCPPSDLPKAVRDLETRGERENRLAVTAFLAGGATVLVGAVMVVMNQPRRVRLEESGRRIGVVPIVSPEGTGVAVTIPF
jgi:hypothetical protein